jgi:hypothetical protein
LYKDASIVISGEITPGVYGRVDTAKKPNPPLVFEQPMFVERPDTAGRVEPLYMHVPPEHAKAAGSRASIAATDGRAIRPPFAPRRRPAAHRE